MLSEEHSLHIENRELRARLVILVEQMDQLQSKMLIQSERHHRVQFHSHEELRKLRSIIVGMGTRQKRKKLQQKKQLEAAIAKGHIAFMVPPASPTERQSLIDSLLLPVGDL